MPQLDVMGPICSLLHNLRGLLLLVALVAIAVRTTLQDLASCEAFVLRRDT